MRAGSLLRALAAGSRLAASLPAGLLFAIAALLVPALALADPHTGVGLFGGLAVHKGNVQLADGEVFGFTSSGPDAGIEYQRVLTPELSLAGFAEGSLERVDGDASQFYGGASHGVLGIQLRYWEGAKWVGAHVGAYSEALAAKSGSGATDTQASGWGGGLAGGWEGDSGWLVMGRVDLAQVAYTNAVHGLTGIRLIVGYRWRQAAP